jgi:pimeloyl-ACP methyl ester carboxylesterase
VVAAQLATVNGARLRYRLSGDGLPLVAQAPGWGIGCAAYEQTWAPLAQDALLLCYDPRGSGDSQRDVDPETLNVGQFVADLEGLRGELRLARLALMGHSHGGYIALNYALAHPQRVSHLILVDAQVGAFEPGGDMQQQFAALARQPEYADAMAALTSPWELATDADLGALVGRILPLYFHDVANAAELARIVAQSPPALAPFRTTMATDEGFPVIDRLGEIAAPALVLNGRHDRFCPPSQAETLRRGIPEAELVLFERSGHFPWIEEPEAFFAAVRSFLRWHPGA